MEELVRGGVVVEPYRRERLAPRAAAADPAIERRIAEIEDFDREQLAGWYTASDDTGTSTDVESWVEQRTRIRAAFNVLGPEKVWFLDPILDGAVQRDMAYNPATGARTPAWFVRHLPRLGPISTVRAQNWLELIHHVLPTGYFPLSGFLENAGRVVYATTLHSEVGEFEEKPDATENAILRLAHTGHTRVVLKSAHGKHALLNMEIPDVNTPREVTPAFLRFEEFPWIHLEDRPAGILVQELVAVEYEYRLHIIGGKIVTGAGAINALTPLSNEAPFDRKVVRTRYPGNANMDAGTDASAPSWGWESADIPAPEAVPETIPATIESRPDLVGRYLDFARRVVAELAAEQPKMTDYSLDVAMINGAPGVIELNTQPNSGLFACDPELIARAVSDSAPLCRFGEAPDLMDVLRAQHSQG